MADFRLRADAEGWFKHISKQSPFTTKFDTYYLCLLLGLACRRHSNPSDAGDAPGFVSEFTSEYRMHQLSLVGLLLIAELTRFGTGPRDRVEVRRLLSDLVEPGGLSAEGVARLNEYASGGFDHLQEVYGDIKPMAPEEFLPRFADILRDAIEGEETWRQSLSIGTPEE